MDHQPVGRRAAVSADPVERPPAVPEAGAVAPFDAGWEAHHAGLERETVRVLAADPGWALLGWDARQTCAPDWIVP